MADFDLARPVQAEVANALAVDLLERGKAVLAVAASVCQPLSGIVVVDPVDPLVIDAPSGWLGWRALRGGHGDATCERHHKTGETALGDAEA